MAADIPNAHQPIPRLGRPLRVRLVAGVGEQSRAEVDEAGIGGGVLVPVTQVEGENLPPESAVAVLVVPPDLLAIPHPLRQRQPLRLARRGVGELVLRRRHGAHAPKRLIVVSLLLRHVGRHVVVVRADLEHHPFHDEVVVAVVAGVVVVVHQCAEHRPCFPPVVRRVGEEAGDLGDDLTAHAGGVPEEHVLGDLFGRRFDGGGRGEVEGDCAGGSGAEEEEGSRREGAESSEEHHWCIGGILR